MIKKLIYCKFIEKKPNAIIEKNQVVSTMKQTRINTSNYSLLCFVVFEENFTKFAIDLEGYLYNSIFTTTQPRGS